MGEIANLDRHSNMVLGMLKQENPRIDCGAVLAKAQEVVDHCINQPSVGIQDQPPTSDVLIYGPIQSGKTSVITAAIGVALDKGFRCIIVLTSDINLLYTQTYNRLVKGLRTVAVMGKDEWPDSDSLKTCIADSSVVIVCSKNVSKLKTLLDALRRAEVRSLRALIVDDEADQASLNTHARNADVQVSAVNAAINDLRGFFKCDRFVQATATPQSLFLQQPGGPYRPRFTVLTEPGSDYIGGDFYFGLSGDSKFKRNSPLRDVELGEVLELAQKKGPAASGSVPTGLRRALNSFFVAASVRLISNPTDCYAFLCHVSVKKIDHDYLARIIRGYCNEMAQALNSSNKTTAQKGLVSGLGLAYEDLSGSGISLPSIDEVVSQLATTIRAASVRIINASSETEVALDRPYSIFVGGNKLGRGVTIRNLLTSYYGRNPKRPNADTVLQHARMYGYRRQDAGLIRLFLPDELAVHFANISQMENNLRKLIAEFPGRYVEGIPLELPVQPTRPGVVPRDIITYFGGGTCNPSFPLFATAPTENMTEMERLVSKYPLTEPYSICPISDLIRVVQLSEQDPEADAVLWNPDVLVAALTELSSRFGPDGYIRVRRGRNVKIRRDETQGMLSGGEAKDVRDDRVTLFIYEMVDGKKVAWWPQLRFPRGSIVLYFNPENQRLVSRATPE